MANSAFDHSPTIIVPGSSTNTALVRWSSTGADTFLDSTLVLSTSATPTLGIAADPDLLTFGNGTIAITGAITGVTTLTASGVITGVGSGLTSLPAGNLTGTLPAIDGSNLTNLPAGATFVRLGSQVASNSTTLDFTGLDDTYDSYLILIAGLRVATDNVTLWLRVGDTSGFDSEGSDYEYHTMRSIDNNSGHLATTSDAAAQIVLAGATQLGNAADEGYGAALWLTSNDTMQALISGSYTALNSSFQPFGGSIMGHRQTALTLDRFQILASSGNLAGGRVTLYGVAHE